MIEFFLGIFTGIVVLGFIAWLDLKSKIGVVKFTNKLSLWIIVCFWEFMFATLGFIAGYYMRLIE